MNHGEMPLPEDHMSWEILPTIGTAGFGKGDITDIGKLGKDNM